MVEQSLPCAKCALQDLDPTGKFSSVANVWSFNAANVSTGAGVPFSSCCNAQVCYLLDVCEGCTKMQPVLPQSHPTV